MCSNDVKQTVTSPDGKLKAVVFERGCGATTGFSTQVSVLAAGDTLPNDGGSVFVESIGDPVSVRWQSNRQLIIQHKPTELMSEKQIQVPTGLISSEAVFVTYAP